MDQTYFPGGDDASVNVQMLHKALEFLHKCRETHPACHPKDPSFRPTRLLDIRSPKDQVKLVQFDNSCEPSTIEYACLSHRWHREKLGCMTTRTTLEDNKAGIAWSRLPQTFQNAIVFARRLGLNYFWIDNLCIIQEDEDDWLHEGSKMAEIYSNATITLAATCATDWNNGLYVRPRYPLPGGHHCDWLRYDTEWNTHHRPLTSRAWYFQEQHLSPRIIHFYYDRLLWKCQAARTCSCPGRESFPSLSSGTNDHIMTDDELWAQWPKIVSPYTACHLTHNSDRLMALSGVAKAHGYLEQGYKYVAGIWMKDGRFPLGFDWRTWGRSVERRQTAHPRDWAAPTWSWASSIESAVDGNIINNWPSNYDTRPEFRIHDINMNLKYQGDETGPLERENHGLNRISVTGSAAKGTLVYDNGERWNNPWEYRVCIRGDEPIGGRFQADFAIRKEDEESHIKSGSPVVLFKLFTTSDSGAICLVLSQKLHEGKAVFERIARLDVFPGQFAKIEDLVTDSTFCLV